VTVRRLMMMLLVILVPFLDLTETPTVSARSPEPPEGAREFADRHFRELVENLVFAGEPETWGFSEDKGTITFGELVPVYGLNTDFARGASDDILSGKEPDWVAVIFQNGRPVNAIGTRKNSEGGYGLAAVGYPPELPYGLLHVQEDDVIVHVFPVDHYYVYSKQAEIVRKLEADNGSSRLGEPMTKTQFQQVLKNRLFPEQEKRISNVSLAGLILVLVVISLGGGWLFFGIRRWRARRSSV